MLVALVMLVGGLFVAPPRSAVMIGAGLALGSLAGIELSFREHFAGYRSHTMLMSGVLGVGVIAGLFALDPEPLPPLARLLIGVAVFAAAAWGLTRAFRRRSGGASFKVR